MKAIGTFPVQTLKAHVALNVNNVESSIEFYTRMLGTEPCKVRTDYAKFDVQNPPLNLTLNQVPTKERGALSHMGIQVSSSEDVFTIRQQWADAGLYTRDEMQTNCCYAIQDKTWVHDPDGNEWEVFVVLEDNLAETTMCCLPDASGVSSCDVPAAMKLEPIAVEAAPGCTPSSGCC